ncbi:MAG: protein-L-isoaspartate O-methyltransferase, partial [Alphaproteobacteria bacterium]|nr:protein-L-isoaspartate O-methyltransferase [Alphaproteobacteria bacterium]
SGQLSVGGIMVVPIGDDPESQRIVRVRRQEDGLDIDDLGPVKFVPLVSDREAEPLSG